MAHPFPVASVFTEGMRRDADRTMLPGGSVWNLVDFIPDEIQAAASGRGGWTYAGPVMTSAFSGGQVAYHPDTGKVYYADGFGIFDVAAGGIALGAVRIPIASPMSYHRGLLFAGSAIVTGVPRQSWYLKDDGTAAQFVAGPLGVYTGVYKDHALLARQQVFGLPHGSSQNLNRIWFSAAGDPTTWDLNFGWWDTTGAITGIASAVNAILIFHGGTTERLRGTTPPPGSDMVLEPFFNDGCIDANSIAYWNERVVWASSRGIYLTDGATVVDLTQEAQMKTYWTSLLSGYTSSYRIAGGIYRDHYIISIYNGSTLVDCLCVSLNNRTMWRFSNVNGASFVSVTDAKSEKLYMAQNNAARVVELSSLWAPSASVKQDGDGTNPTPIIETGSFRGYDRLHRRWIQSMGLQKWGYVYTDYDLRDAAADNPTLSLSYALSPGGAYTSLVGGDLPETSDYSRKRRSIGQTVGGAKRSNMMELKVAVNGPYATCNLYTLEAAFEPVDIGRLQ